MDIGKNELVAIIQYQLGALEGILRMEGMTLSHVKCHGALYNRARHDAEVAAAVVEAVGGYRDNLPLYVLPFSCVEEAAAHAGVPFVREAFADRAYHENGALVDRRRADAMVLDTDEVAKRVVDMAVNGKVTSVEGVRIKLNPDSICFHADTPPVIAFLESAHRSLSAAGIRVGTK
jgi:UPF0271 protein